MHLFELCSFFSELMSPLVPQVLTWGRQYKLSLLKSDAVAACTIAAVAVPQGLAYAKLAEVDPVHGQQGMQPRLC